jgi:hypothetical protein
MDCFCVYGKMDSEDGFISVLMMVTVDRSQAFSFADELRAFDVVTIDKWYSHDCSDYCCVYHRICDGYEVNSINTVLEG